MKLVALLWILHRSFAVIHRWSCLWIILKMVMRPPTNDKFAKWQGLPSIHQGKHVFRFWVNEDVRQAASYVEVAVPLVCVKKAVVCWVLSTFRMVWQWDAPQDQWSDVKDLTDHRSTPNPSNPPLLWGGAWLACTLACIDWTCVARCSKTRGSLAELVASQVCYDCRWLEMKKTLAAWC